MTELQALKPSQDMEFRRQNTIAILSGKLQKTPTEAAFNRYNPKTEVPNKDIPGGFLNIPVNRVFGFFPLSRGTLLTNKVERRNLANNSVYDAIWHGIRINDQEQPTNRFVAGLNYQKETTTEERFKDVEGNAEGSHSRVKHADNSKESNVSHEMSIQFRKNKSNPMVKEAKDKNSIYERMFGA